MHSNANYIAAHATSSFKINRNLLSLGNIYLWFYLEFFALQLYGLQVLSQLSAPGARKDLVWRRGHFYIKQRRF